MAEEVLIPFEASPRPNATSIRSTLICSSLQALRTRGLFDAYWAIVPDEHKPTIETVLPGNWLPISVGVAHYVACDSLLLDHDERVEMGADVGRRVHKSTLSVLVKMSREAGVSPWTAMNRIRKLRDLTWQGSDFAVYKLGPKDARIVWVAQPCAASTHFVYGFAGFFRALMELFCQKAYTRILTAKRTQSSFEIRASWA